MFEGAAVSNEKARAIFYLPRALCLHHAAHTQTNTHTETGAEEQGDAQMAA